MPGAFLGAILGLGTNAPEPGAVLLNAYEILTLC